MTNEQIEEELRIETEVFMEDQPLNEEDEALVDLIYDRLDIFVEMNQPYHDKAREAREILRLQDPNQDIPDAEGKMPDKETLQLQTLKSTINNVVADQMLSMPEAKMLPQTADKQEQADLLQEMVHYVIYCANDYESTHRRRCEDFYGPGTAVIQTGWDENMNYGKGEIAIVRWPIEAFLWDGSADNIQDCRAVMKVSWHPLSWYREHWPDAGKYVGAEDGKNHDVGRLGDQFDEHSGDEKNALLVEYWWRTYDATTKRYKINVALVAGHALLEKHEDVYAHGRYPFSIDVHDSIEGSLAGDGLVSELANMMRYINRYMSYADMNARMSSKGRLLLDRKAGIDKNALVDWQTDIIEGDKIDPSAIQWLTNQPFNGNIVNLLTMLESDLKADSGANQFTRGETTGGIVSGKAINSLIQAGGKISSMRTEILKSGFKEMVEQIIWLMAQFYDDGRVMMITGKNGMHEIKVDTEQMFGIQLDGAVPPPPYTVQIEISSRDPQRVANRNQMFMEAYTMSAQTQFPMRLSTLFKLLNLDGKDNILPAIEADEKYYETLQQMQQQLQQLQEQIGSVQNENQSLRRELTDTTNDLAEMSATRGSPQKDASVNDPNNPSAIVENARSMMGVQTGAPLPT